MLYALPSPHVVFARQTVLHPTGSKQAQATETTKATDETKTTEAVDNTTAAADVNVNNN